jgi:hypothetical protein
VRFENVGTTLRVRNSPPRRASLLVAAFGLVPTLIIATTTFPGPRPYGERVGEFLGHAGMLWVGLALFYGILSVYWYSGPVSTFDRERGELRMERGRKLVRRVRLERIRWTYLESRHRSAGAWYRVVLVLHGEEEIRLGRRWGNDVEQFHALEREILAIIGHPAPQPEEHRRPPRRRKCWFCGRPARSAYGVPLLLRRPHGVGVSRKIPRCARCAILEESHEKWGPILAIIAAAALTVVPYVRLVVGQPTPRLALILLFPVGVAFFAATAGGILGIRLLLEPRRFAPRTAADWEGYQLVVRMRCRGWAVRLEPRDSGLDT